MSAQFPETERVAPIGGPVGVEPAATTYGTTETLQGNMRVLYPARGHWYDLASDLLVDGWNMCLDLTAVDYDTYPSERDLPAGVLPERFEVIATFVSHRRRQRLQARVQVPETNPVLASLYNIFPGVDYAEREVYDLYGVEFEGHPDLSRILMPETWQGHPLRKDYAIGGIPVQFKAPRSKTEDSEPEPT